MTDREQKKAAKDFAEYWKDRGYEKGESQPFWLSLLRVLGTDEPEKFISFEDKVMLDHTSFIDGYISATHVLIEQKSNGKDLRKPIKQSDGTLLSPFQQAKRYSAELPYSERPRWIVTCNFKEFLIYDMENPMGEPDSILLENLPKEYYRLKFLVDTGSEFLKQEMEISIKAGEIVGILYDKLLAQYKNPDESSLRSLNALCVRLVFCLYAEDADIFGSHLLFHDYLKDIPASGIRKALAELFKILDTKESDRDKYLADDNPKLAAFPYVNGGLFADEEIEIPPFTEELKDLLLRKASEDFDWSGISPTIFGAVFESTLNPETRRSGGMHYTSIENIHKVIDPLFLDDLKKELEEILSNTVIKKRNNQLDAFTDKLSKLKFLDPACGSGNFLTETYISLRRLENKVLRAKTNQIAIGDDITNPIKVSISQFYGIEINDFAVTVAKTALWIAESQMMRETEDIIASHIDFLPLKSYANIVEGNALRIDWEDVVSKYELNYIMGNPPFVGASMMMKEQKNEAVEVFGKIKLSNSIDYVGAWYHKAGYYIQNTNIKCAFVSTNSITQGEQVAPLWDKLFKKYDIQIDFAHRTFKWNSEASDKAAVHCVIIGFSQNGKTEKCLYDNDRMQIVKNINPYLIDAPNVLITSRSTPICDVKKATKGNQPSDGGNLILSENDKIEILKKEPCLEKFIYPYIGSVELINNKIRYCFWLKNASPKELRSSRELSSRLSAVAEMRANSTAAPTRAKASSPHLFFSLVQPEDNYIMIPRVSSERRRYIPMGFMPPSVIASDAVTIVHSDNLFCFGVLISNVHMAWMRIVAGRLKSDYRYSGSVVYNTFPWCTPTDAQKAKIEQTAKLILDARALYPDSSLADLYDELTMPTELRKAHRANDRAVWEAYGRRWDISSESSCVAELMKMYQELTKE